MNFRKRELKLALLLILIAVAASAAPISSCTANLSGIGITCNIYESDALGNPSEISNIFSLGTSAVSGYVVLLDSPLADPSNMGAWSDVLHFIDSGSGFATTAQLLSAGCACFPSVATVNAAGGQFIVETQFGTGNDYIDFTTYSPSGTDVYNIYSAAPFTAAPEPGSWWMLAGGFASLGLLRQRNRSSVAR